MTPGTNMAQIAAVVGDPARAIMLAALLGGRPLTAGELTEHAGVTPQTASFHLSKLSEAGLLILRQQGRRRYFALASPEVAHMLEAIMSVSEQMSRPAGRQWRGGDRLRKARTCYDHLAGQLGVAIADGLTASGHLHLTDEGGELTAKGRSALAAAGIDGITSAERVRRPFCRPCLDWSERRYHLAGRLGAAIAEHALRRHWVERLADTRAVLVTPEGERQFASVFGMT